MLIDRRHFTKTLTACAAAYWLKSLKTPNDPTTQLQVFFHGLWAFVVKAGTITAVTTSICEHCYVAGSLADQPAPFDPGNVTLSGVNSGPGTFSDQANLILPLPNSVNLNAFRNRVIFKVMPASIESRRPATIKFNFGTRKVSTIQVLTYAVTDPSVPPAFSNLTWQPQGATANIHFYAEPGNSVGLPHATAAAGDLTAHLNLSSVSVKQIVSSSGPVSAGDFNLAERGITNCQTDCPPAGSAPKPPKKPDRVVNKKKPNQKGPDKGPDVANCMTLVLTG